jgi:hypothetical protein
VTQVLILGMHEIIYDRDFDRDRDREIGFLGGGLAEAAARPSWHWRNACKEAAVRVHVIRDAHKLWRQRCKVGLVLTFSFQACMFACVYHCAYCTASHKHMRMYVSHLARIVTRLPKGSLKMSTCFARGRFDS